MKQFFPGRSKNAENSRSRNYSVSSSQSSHCSANIISYTRNLTARHINEFLPKRPSTDILIKNHLVQNTMTWSIENVIGTPPSARNCHTAAVVGNKMYVLGGYNENCNSSDGIECNILNLEKMKWDKSFIAGAVPCDMYSHSCVTVGTNLILFGGYSINDTCWTNKLCVLDTKLTQRFIPSLSLKNDGGSCVEELSMLFWYKLNVKGDSPSPRAAMSAVTMGNKVYYFGGNNGGQFFNDFYELDLDIVRWRKIKCGGQIPSPRAGHTATIVENNRMIVFGGGVENGYSNEIFFLDLKTFEWSSPKIDGTAPCPRAGHTAITILNKTAVLVFGGGFNEKVFGDLNMFDVETCKWTRPSDAGYLPQARAGHSCVTVSNIAYFFGGADGDNHVFNDVYSLDTAFLVLKNINKNSRVNYKLNLSPMNNFDYFRDKCVNDLDLLENKVENMIVQQIKFSEINLFLIKELIEKTRKENEKRVRDLEEVKKELQNHRETLFSRQEMPKGKERPADSLNVEAKCEGKSQTKEIAWDVKNKVNVRSVLKGSLREQNKKSVVKSVCTLFESLAINNVCSVDTPNKKKKHRCTKKNKLNK